MINCQESSAQGDVTWRSCAGEEEDKIQLGRWNIAFSILYSSLGLGTQPEVVPKISWEEGRTTAQYPCTAKGFLRTTNSSVFICAVVLHF